MTGNISSPSPSPIQPETPSSQTSPSTSPQPTETPVSQIGKKILSPPSPTASTRTSTPLIITPPPDSAADVAEIGIQMLPDTPTSSSSSPFSLPQSPSPTQPKKLVLPEALPSSAAHAVKPQAKPLSETIIATIKEKFPGNKINYTPEELLHLGNLLNNLPEAAFDHFLNEKKELFFNQLQSQRVPENILGMKIGNSIVDNLHKLANSIAQKSGHPQYTIVPTQYSKTNRQEAIFTIMPEAVAEWQQYEKALQLISTEPGTNVATLSSIDPKIIEGIKKFSLHDPGDWEFKQKTTALWIAKQLLEDNWNNELIKKTEQMLQLLPHDLRSHPDVQHIEQRLTEQKEAKQFCKTYFSDGIHSNPLKHAEEGEWALWSREDGQCVVSVKEKKMAKNYVLTDVNYKNKQGDALSVHQAVIQLAQQGIVDPAKCLVYKSK